MTVLPDEVPPLEDVELEELEELLLEDSSDAWEGAEELWLEEVVWLLEELEEVFVLPLWVVQVPGRASDL